MQHRARSHHVVRGAPLLRPGRSSGAILQGHLSRRHRLENPETHVFLNISEIWIAIVVFGRVLELNGVGLCHAAISDEPVLNDLRLLLEIEYCVILVRRPVLVAGPCSHVKRSCSENNLYAGFGMINLAGMHQFMNKR